MHLRSIARTAAILALGWFPAAGAGAQQRAAVSGTVLDAVSSAPLADVLVTIVGTERSARTDGEGQYQIVDIEPGLVKVIAQIIGYHPITTPYYNLKPGATTPVHFKLAPLQIQLDPVEIIGERPAEAWAFGARVLRSEDLPRRGNILESLDGLVAGIRTFGRREDTRISVRNSASDVLYVLDGVVIKPPFTFYVDAADVECIEIRRGYHAAQEFRPSLYGETYSGVLLIWTKGSTARKPRECTQPRSG
jgi:hypothetical protein